MPRVGIVPCAAMKARTVAIARSERRAAEPREWDGALPPGSLDPARNRGGVRLAASAALP